MGSAMPLTTGPAQRLASITKAELGKLLARGGIRRWVVAATVLGLAAGLLTILLNHDDGLRESINLTVAGSLSSGPLMVIFVLGIAATNYVPREVSDGTIVTAKCLVPRTSALFAGRLLAWLALSIAVSGALVLATLTIALLDSSVQPSPVGSTVLAGLMSVVVAALTIVLVHSGALALQRGAFTVAVGMTVLLMIPLGLAVGQVLLSGWLAVVSTRLGEVMLGTLVLNALSVPEGTNGADWGGLLRAVLGLVAWLGATTGLAWRSFARPGYGDG